MKICPIKKPLKILFVGTEAAPFVKVGGLGSVMHSLPEALCELGHDARVLVPKYLSINDEFFDLKMEMTNLEVPTDNPKGEKLICNVKRCDPGGETSCLSTFYFLENQEYYEQRANVYGYADDTIRWALLCRGTLEFLKSKNDWTPDVIVCSDWQSALIPNYLKTVYSNDIKMSKISTVFSIHNLCFQSLFDHRFVSEMDFDDGHSDIPGFNSERLSKINWMRRGIIYADSINTVSPNYAKEIMTKDFGELLDDLLRERKAVLSGILNGIDYSIWDPENDVNIPNNYSPKTISNRSKNKEVLQERFNLPIDNDVFVISIVGRLNKQKGLDLLYSIMDFLLQELPIQFIVVGYGDSDFLSFFHDLETRYPKKVAVHLKFDNVLPHIVFAGTDLVLVPSRFEPCGLTQMEAMRMGAIPVVRKTGGLADSVEDFNPEKQTGTGFVFERFDSNSLMISLIRAFENFRDKSKWMKLQQRAMQKDFSWKASAKKYVELFTKTITNSNKKV